MIADENVMVLTLDDAAAVIEATRALIQQVEIWRCEARTSPDAGTVAEVVAITMPRPELPPICP